MWELVNVSEDNKGELDQYLADNYEPFAVSVDPFSGYHTVWLKRWSYGVVEGEETMTAEQLADWFKPSAQKTPGAA